MGRQGIDAVPLIGTEKGQSQRCNLCVVLQAGLLDVKAPRVRHGLAGSVEHALVREQIRTGEHESQGDTGFAGT
jgi:hypothetical protein